MNLQRRTDAFSSNLKLRGLMMAVMVFAASVAGAVTEVPAGRKAVHSCVTGRPAGLTVCRQTDPVGLDAVPALSWKLPAGVAEQTAYEIEADGWSSGKVSSSQQIDVLWKGSGLKTSQRVSWRVRVWDGRGVVSDWSERASFVMGVLRPEDWKAVWIGPDPSTRGEGVDDERTSPAFAKTFMVRKPVARATLHVTGLGFYEAYLNGKKVGRKVLDPSPTDYTKRVLYSTYVLDGAVKEGANTLRILIGHGWYDMRSKATWKFNEAPWRDAPKAIAQLELVYADGMSETVVTGADWEQVESEVIFDDLREGEIRGCKHAGTAIVPPGLMARLVSPPAGRLVAEPMPGAEVMETIAPRDIRRDRHGNWIVTFPENLSGWARIDFRGLKADDEVSIRYDENLTPSGDAAVTSARKGHNPKADGTPDERFIDMFFLGGEGHRFIRGKSEMQCDHFVSSGRPVERFEPAFVYHGFRHLVIGGYPGPLKAEDVCARYVRTAFPETGSFACSDEKLTELVRLARNSYKANFTDGIPTDCPHREKLGWTGDAWVASEFAQFFFENTAAYRKWLGDVIDTMTSTGELCCIAPTAGFGYAWGNGPVFDAALGMLPLNLWRYRADRTSLETAYPALVRYLAYLKTIESAPDLVRKGLGDWNSDWDSRKRSPEPEPEFVISCLYLRLREIAAMFAEVLEKAAEAADFRAAAGRSRTAIHAKYAGADGVYANGSTVAQALAVVFRLAPEAERPVVEAKLVATAASRGAGWGEFGLMGAKYVYRALSEIGRGDLALAMLVSDDVHSPARWIGKTGTLWEDRGFGLSKCHVMLGDFAAWAMEHVVGISPAEPGFRKIRIAPRPPPSLTWAQGETETPYGSLRVAWKRVEGRLLVDASVPPGTTAVLDLPDDSPTPVNPLSSLTYPPPKAPRRGWGCTPVPPLDPPGPLVDSR